MRVALAIFLCSLAGVASAAMFSPNGTGGGIPQGPVIVACGGSIQAGINAAGIGGIIQLAGSAATPCTYSNQTFTPQQNQTIQGDTSNATGANTILDGTGVTAATQLTNGYTASVTGVTIQNLTVQKYTGTHSAGCSLNQLTTFDGWTLTKDTFQNAGCNGVDLKGLATLTNSKIIGNGTSGVFSEPGYSATSNAIQIVTGNEIANNGSSDSVGNNAAGLKSVPSACAEAAVATQGLSANANYVHDNTGVGLWSDCWAGATTFDNNTVIANSAAGIMCEISIGCDIEDNVVKLNGTGSTLFQGDIFVASSSNATVANNFVEVSNSFTRNGGPIVQAQCRNDVPTGEYNDNVYQNTVVFDGFTNGQGVSGQIDGTNLGANCPSDKFPVSWVYYDAWSNSFWSPSSSDAHWTGNAQGYGTNETLAAIQAGPYGNELGSTISTSSAPTAAGCTAIGCTSSGWPVSPPVANNTYFISPSGSDSNNCLTTGTACASPNGVAAKVASLKCGDTISAATGTYSQTNMTITSTPSCAGQNDVVMVKCATAFGCAGTTQIAVEASYWGLAGWTMTSASLACILAKPPTNGQIGALAFVNNITSGCVQGGIVYFQNGTGGVGDSIDIGDIAYNSASGTADCYTGITHGSMRNFLPGSEELYAAWHFAYGNTSSGSGATACGGTNTDQSGLNFDTMNNYTGAAVAENNWLGWNGGPGFEFTTSGSINAGPIIARYNTMVNNLTQASIVMSTATEFLGGASATGELLATYTHNLAQGNGAQVCSGSACVVAFTYSPKDTSATSIFDDNWGFESNTGCGQTGCGAEYYGGKASTCLPGHATPVGPNSSGSYFGTNNLHSGICSGNSMTTSPVLTSTTEPSAPSCSGQSDTPRCFATQIANLVSTAVGSTAFGAQVAAPTDAYNANAFVCHVYHEMPATMFQAGGGPIPNRC